MELADAELAVGEFDDEIEGAAEGFDQAAEGADLHVVLLFHLGEGGLGDAQGGGKLSLGEAGLGAQLCQQNTGEFLLDGFAVGGLALWGHGVAEFGEWVAVHGISPSFLSCWMCWS